MWEALKKLDHYGRSVLVALPAAIVLLIPLILDQSPFLLLDSNPLLGLITIPIFAANVIAIATYAARLLDFMKSDFPVDDNDPARPGRKRERIGTILSTFLGIALGILLERSSSSIPFAPTLCTLANILFIGNRACVFAGLGARASSTGDSARPAGERYSMIFAGIIGAGLGIAVLIFASPAAVTTFGITTVLTSGAGLPMWANSFIFVTTLTSLITSVADYTSKAGMYLFGNITRQNNRFHEYRGSYYGTLTGSIVGGAALFLLQPQLGAIAALLVFATAVTAFASIFSRVGRAGGDGLFPASSTAVVYEKLQQHEPPAPTAGPKPANSLTDKADPTAQQNPPAPKPSGTPANTGMYKPAPDQPPAPSAAPTPSAAPGAAFT